MRLNNLRFLALALLLSACGGEQKQAAPAAPPPDAKKVDAATAGAITGRVLFDGVAPQNPQLQMKSDPVCARANPDGSTAETILVSNGGLDNVFVYVKDGLGNYYFEPPASAVKLDQQGCRYTPHVFGVQVGQPIEIINSDATLHNVHATAQVNRPFNLGQHLQGMKNVKTFTVPEVMIRFKCDVHGWMSAYAGVVPHPYYAVTRDGGSFALKDVPAGTYTIEAWHEKFGTQTQQVTIGEKESKAINFSFKAALP